MPEPSRYDDVVAAAEKIFAMWGVVPIVGEFGCAANQEERDACHSSWIDAFERRGWSWCLWNFNPDADPDDDDAWCGERFSVAQRDGGGEVALSPAYDGLLRPFPRRYGGPVEVEWDDRNSRFTARIGKAFQTGWRTEIFVPTSLGDFDVSGGEREDRKVVVDTDAGEGVVDITLRGG
jgi:hypothetical protein